MKIAYNFGILDLFHYGHLNALKIAKNENDILYFGLFDDETTKNWYGNTISSYQERYEVVSSIEIVDEVLVQDSINPIKNLKRIRAEYPNAVITLYHGDDWQVFPSNQELTELGINLTLTKYYEKLSPRNILKKMSQEEVGNRIISTKGRTLDSLSKVIKKSKVEDLLLISRREFHELPDSVLLSKISDLSGEFIVIRSSSVSEDNLLMSNAGHYESFLNVKSDDLIDIRKKIQQVFDSYEVSDESSLFYDEEVLIQSQASDVQLSGVIFTRDIVRNRPYYVINYSDKGDTDYITSGKDGKLIYIYNEIDIVDVPSSFRGLVESIREIEKIAKGMILDIEFAITTRNEIVIFQVRPLAANYKYLRSESNIDLKTIISHERQKFCDLKIGEFSEIGYSDMSFWNPSEIIGDNPHPLDYSLYREIITKREWNSGLLSLGYNDTNSELMYKFGNKPYISLLLSFKALTPHSIKESTQKKLFNYYGSVLKQQPEIHDKIEFDLVFNTYNLSTEKNLKKLLKSNFSEEEVGEISTSLYELTSSVISSYRVMLDSDRDTLSELVDFSCSKNLSNYFGCSFKTVVNEINISLDVLREKGTGQFARQARCAFISKSLLFSFVDNGYFSSNEVERFMTSLETVASQYDSDFKLLNSNLLSKEDFMDKYGHLRSGTYDILSKRYDQLDFSTYSRHGTVLEEKYDFYDLDEEVLLEIIEVYGFAFSIKDLSYFLKETIISREFFKFEFTKTLSYIIELISILGDKLGFSRLEMSYVTVEDILSLARFDDVSSAKDYLRPIIKGRKGIYQELLSIRLPELLFDISDFEVIKMNESRPNFITSKKIISTVTDLCCGDMKDITGKIVIIEKADPGYDWIFGYDIAGLITKYGGVASHMSIRCAEFGLPAAIGVGEKLYSDLRNSNEIELDASNKIIRRIS